MRAELSGRGYTIEESTLAMGMSLDDISLALPEVELGPLDWPEYLEYLGSSACPPACSAAPTRARSTPSRRGRRRERRDRNRLRPRRRLRHVQHVHARGGTAARARHRAHRRHVHDAAERGCSTASLQSTAMAERLYAAVGFRDLGRILEYVP